MTVLHSKHEKMPSEIFIYRTWIVIQIIWMLLNDIDRILEVLIDVAVEGSLE